MTDRVTHLFWPAAPQIQKPEPVEPWKAMEQERLGSIRRQIEKQRDERKRGD
jgi:hypothetical protein